MADFAVPQQTLYASAPQQTLYSDIAQRVGGRYKTPRSGAADPPVGPPPPEYFGPSTPLLERPMPPGPSAPCTVEFDCSNCVVKNGTVIMAITIFLILIFATLCILVWFGDQLSVQVGAFIISFVGLVLAILSVALPVKCQPCGCQKPQ